MQMTLEQFAARFPDRPAPVPLEFAGDWIAWDHECRKIVAHGRDMSDVRNRAIAEGFANPVLQKVPRAPFVGRP
jgi:hypothetical protein